MTARIFRGDSNPVAKIGSFTITADDAATTYSVTMNTKKISVAGTGTGVNNTAAALQQALANSSIPEFLEVTWSVNAAVITATAATPGFPFIDPVTSKSGGTGTIGAYATTTASAGPNHLDDATNWSDLSNNTGLPVNTDDIYFTGTNVDAKWGLDGLVGVQPNSVTIDASYTGKIGLPDFSISGYKEPRQKYFQLNGVTAGVNIGRGIGQRSGRIKLDFRSTNPATVNCDGMAAPFDNGQPALNLLGTNASNVLNATLGNIGIATEDGTTAQWPTINVGYQTSQPSDVTLTLGSGLTSVTALTQDGGIVTAYCSVVTWTKSFGTSTNYGTTTITTLNQDLSGGGAATHFWLSNGTITTANVRGARSYIDASGDDRSKTITNGTFLVGGYFLDPLKKIAFGNPFTMDLASVQNTNFGSGQLTINRT